MMRIPPKDPRERSRIVNDRWKLRGGIIVLLAMLILLFFAMLF